jgi:hypothetical protein
LQILIGSSTTEYLQDPHGTARDADKVFGGDGMLAEMSSGLTPPYSKVCKTKKQSALSCVVDTRIPADVDTEQQCGNTAVCVVRVWWEEAIGGEGESYMTKGFEAKGRVEVWGDLAHLDR